MSGFPPLPDQADRDRFLNETDANFSVIAPAGVGKTTAIVGRIARIGAQDADRAEPLLPHLAVVTYTNKAAEELQERARRQLLQQAAGDERLLKLFGRAFFGTIHSFCLELLRRHGHHLGLPPALELAENAAERDALWLRFIRSQDRLSELVPEPIRADFLKIAPLGKMLELARELPGDPLPPPGPRPEADFTELFAIEGKGRSAAKIEQSQQVLRAWSNALTDPATRGLGIPAPATTAQAFVAAWGNAFQPVQDWLAQAGLAFASAVARRFRQFRLEAGQLTYDDMITLADQLLGVPAALAEVRSHRWRIILDEAQDTDPAQFRILTAAARDRGVPTDWPGSGEAPEGGRFCMVGDPQQSIYSERADLRGYLALHRALSTAPGGAALTFTVTMRCDQAVVTAVNTAFPAVLDGEAGQVELVPLEARPGVLPGRVERLPLSPEPAGTRKRDKLEAEAAALADWLAARGPAGLGARAWGEVALLCPRKDGLEALAFHLEKRGLPVQNHSRNDQCGDDPAFAWVAGLFQVLAHPGDSFELFGVLREVFAVADGEMAALVRAAKDAELRSPLHLESRPEDVPGQTGECLTRLHAVRQRCLRLPLREALEHLLAATALPARLAALPGVSPQRLALSLDALRLEAAAAESRGETLGEFARALRRRYAEAPGEAPAAPDRLQLLTCHKSKGLEWPVVLLPLFFSPIKDPNPNYPQLFGGPGEPPVLAVSKSHDRDATKAAQARRTAQTYERLLYVSATRARHSLIVVGDEALFDKPAGSFAAGLRALPEGANRPWWDALPAFAPKTEPFPARHTPAGEEATDDAPDADAASPDEAHARLARARTHAETFPERLLPSSLARHEGFEGHHRDERDLEAEPLFPELAAAAAAKKGADYGNWWHLTMETMPWAEGENAWHEHAAARLAACPDPPRGEHELGLFAASAAARRLADPALCIRTEVPIFWPADARRVYDGTIDLAARTDTGWLVIDWKTDRVPPGGGLAVLAATYGPQLACYRHALGAIYDVPVEVYLYSTRKGEWLALEDQEEGPAK